MITKEHEAKIKKEKKYLSDTDKVKNKINNIKNIKRREHLIKLHRNVLDLDCKIMEDHIKYGWMSGRLRDVFESYVLKYIKQ
jgi:hypothetical protein|tara:strand:- start:9918 stop:10163 length:246 start_codon:yes stop_codon:yes gene_type:complete